MGVVSQELAIVQFGQRLHLPGAGAVTVIVANLYGAPTRCRVKTAWGGIHEVEKFDLRPLAPPVLATVNGQRISP